MALASARPLALVWQLQMTRHPRSAILSSFLQGSQALSTAAASLEGENANVDATKETSTVTSTTSTPPKKKEEVKSKKPGDKEEIGGPQGPEPTRYNDWERKGRVSDF
jgi:hypothetical protein